MRGMRTKSSAGRVPCSSAASTNSDPAPRPRVARSSAAATPVVASLAATVALLIALSSCLLPYAELSEEHAEAIVPRLFASQAQLEEFRSAEIVWSELLYDESIRALDDGGVSISVFGGQPKLNKGVRAEVAVDYPFEEGETVSYGWGIRIPSGFAHDEAGGNRWWVMGQWHDQPNPNRGETWDDIPSRSPPVAYYFGELDGEYGLILHYGTGEGDSVGVDHLIPLPADTWVRLETRVTWSQSEAGRVQVFVDDEAAPRIDVSAANMHNDYQHYLKLGQYRHPDINTDNSVHFRNLRIE